MRNHNSRYFARTRTNLAIPEAMNSTPKSGAFSMSLFLTSFVAVFLAGVAKVVLAEYLDK
jgi:hypothetical protein